MEVPILKQGPYLMATIQSALNDADLLSLRDALVSKVGKFRSRGVIMDVTALDVMDSFATRVLGDIAVMIRLRGARMVIVGIQPEVAFAMVKLGLTFSGVDTALDLEEGLAFLDVTFKKKSTDESHSRGR
jgi:rsbT antagonist protein RsbS